MVERSKYLEELLEDSGEFDEVYSSSDPNKLSSFTLRPGDVLVSNGAFSAGILGHAGIATATTRILHISGQNNEPPQTISLNNWHKNYTNRKSNSWTKVYRNKNATTANRAVSWAISAYAGSKAEYSLHMNLERTDKTYCSKIVCPVVIENRIATEY